MIQQQHQPVLGDIDAREADAQAAGDLAGGPSLEPEQIEKIEKKVAQLFRHIDGDEPFAKELKQLCSERLINRLKGGGQL